MRMRHISWRSGAPGRSAGASAGNSWSLNALTTSSSSASTQPPSASVSVHQPLVVEADVGVVEQPDLGQVPPPQQHLDAHVGVGHVGDADDQVEPGTGGGQAAHGPQQGAGVDQVLDHVEGQHRRERAVADDALQGGCQRVLVAREVEHVALEATLAQGGDGVGVDVGTHVAGPQVPHRLGQRSRRAAQVQHQALAHPRPRQQLVAVAVRAVLAELPRVLLHSLPPTPPGSHRYR